MSFYKELVSTASEHTNKSGFFFVGGDKKCKKVSLLATTEDQITPLHDAVMNNRLDICKLLLQHGGLCSASVPIQLLVEVKAEGLKIH